MKQFHLTQIDLLLVDPDLNIRNIVRNILHGYGFRDIHLARTLAETRDAITKAMPDLLISEVNLPDGDFCGFIRALRHHEIGDNPFMPVIGITWDPTLEMVGQVIDSGADDLLAKPVSTAQLQDRINNLIVARKPFGVTSDYIGPDRRSDSERETTIPLIEVPNTLKAKATGEEPDADLQQAIDRTIAEVNLHKLDRHAQQINGLLDGILPTLEGGTMTTAVHGMLERLLYVAEDSSRRLRGTPYEHVSDLCRSLIKVTRNILGAGDNPKKKDVNLLRPLGQAIKAGFDAGTAAAAREISASVGG